jgi:hypothetical protein
VQQVDERAADNGTNTQTDVNIVTECMYGKMTVTVQSNGGSMTGSIFAKVGLNVLMLSCN